ncbi:MAG: 1-phosphofructokinase [bacterium]|nr:1-phosphofructokinase [bacterium]MCM1375132.1 1-phosphofructokinase [Muribaculum sp.]
MIYTVTFNPAIDYVVHVEDMQVGCINRMTSEKIYCGGKGINVSLVLRQLGISSRALGFVAGFTGRAIEEELARSGVETDFVHLEKGYTRINVKVRSGQETDINGRGPEISKEEITQLYEKLDRLRDGDMLVLAGSVPDGLSQDVYKDILARQSGKKIKVVVDATGNMLLNVLEYGPFLVKPNHHELGEMFGKSLDGIDEIICHAQRLKEMGAVNVLVSMAEKGAVLVNARGEVLRCGVCQGRVVNTVGAGDSMVAGFIAGSMDGDYEYALKLGSAAGGAAAFSDGLAERNMTYRLLEQLM